MFANLWATVQRHCNLLESAYGTLKNYPKTVSIDKLPLTHSSTFSTSSQLLSKKKIDKSNLPQVDERDLEEKFLHGSGPGGQCVNKSWNACQLKHKPTGLVVKVHQVRSLDMNRKLAREVLVQKLDKLINGEDSVESQEARIARHKLKLRTENRKFLKKLKQSHKEILASMQKSEEGKVVDVDVTNDTDCDSKKQD